MKKICTGILATLLYGTSAAQGFAAVEAGVNRYHDERLIANKADYKANVVEGKLINAWGIATRPAGAGGHFWVTGKDISFQYVGDVRASKDAKLQKLHQEDVPYVHLPVGGDDKFATGVIFVNTKKNFLITQPMDDGSEYAAPAKFMFASDGGIISAWTERKNADGSVDRPDKAVAVVDASADGAQFFGLAVSHDFDTIYAADFGADPQIRVYDKNFKPAKITFDNPFDENKNGRVDAGEYAPFNVQELTDKLGHNHVFVTYAMTQACPKEEVEKGACKEGEIFAGEEFTDEPGLGRVAEFTEAGKLVRVWQDGGALSAPWGIAYAPSDFGKLSGMLLVGNFSSGKIAAYDPKTLSFIGFVRDEQGKPIVIDKLWGLVFGNGASLGDSNALYYAAGPRDEMDGLFGVIRPAK